MLELNKIYCGDCLDLLKKIPDRSIDCIITDPPYGINYYSNYYVDKNPHKEIKNDNKLFIPLIDLWRVLKNNGCMFVFYSHKEPFTDKRIKNTIIWVKNNWSAGDLNGDFGNQFECIAFIPKNDFKLKSKKRYSNVWFFDRIPPVNHPTEKPIPLLKRLIECGSNEHETILDPFSGSGNTCIAAQMTNRQFIGIDIETSYVESAKKRLSQSENTNLDQWFK